MNRFEKEEIPILSETRQQQSDEPVDSNFRRNIWRTRSASISIPMSSLDPRETQQYHTSPLHTFDNSLYGDAKGYGRKHFSLCSSCIPGVIDPDTKVVQQWYKFLAISYFVAIFMDPLFFFLIYVNKDEKCIVINWAMARTLVSLRSVIDVMLLLNILLQFRLAYISPETALISAGDYVDHPKKIALHYLKSYFFIDLFVASPLLQIMILIVLPNSLGSSGANNAKNLLCLVIFVQYIPKLFVHSHLLSGQPRTRVMFDSAWANLSIALLNFMLSGHVVGSCWYLFGLQRVNQCLRDACHRSNLPGCMDLIDCRSKESNISARWINDAGAIECLNSISGSFSYGIYAKAIPLTIETKVINKFVYAFFWGFQQIITLASNQTPSYYLWEVLFTMSITVLGLLFLALLIGNIQNFARSIGHRNVERILRCRDTERWMRRRRLPEDLKRRVRQALRYSWYATKGVYEGMVLENLPEDIQTDIRRHVFKFVKNVRIFSLMDEDDPILDAIRERLIHTMYIKGSRVLSQGSLVQKMVFIVRGKLESVGKDGTSVPLSAGDACGEELLIWYIDQYSESKEGKKVKLQGLGLTSDRTVRCLTNVEAFSLCAKDIEELTTLFARYLKSPRVQGAIRYESAYGKSHRVNRIQVAWTNRKKRLRRANTTQ